MRMMVEEGTVVAGLLVGLNTIDCYIHHDEWR